MSLIRVVAYDHVRRFQISVNIALGMNTIQTIHKLESNDNYGLNLEFAFFERFFEFLQVDTQKLHDQIIVILVRTIGVQPWESNSSVLRDS